MVTNDLHSLVRKNPDVIDVSTLTALTRVLSSKAHISQKQSFFLYREAAECLAAIPILSRDKKLCNLALDGLKHIVSTTSETQHRAAAEAMGALPVSLNTPEINVENECNPMFSDWKDICLRTGISKSAPVKRMGRSFIFDDQPNNRILILKTDHNKENAYALDKEAMWMTYLNQHKHLFPVRFDIPVPVQINGGYVFRLRHGSNMHFSSSIKATYGIAFWSHPDYFKYPNEINKDKQLTQINLRRVIANSALLFGKLSSMGIIHTAPIPLFHNRVQQRRRSDGGLYEWPRGGRLDQWLHSSRFPNFGLSGIRDFEHLTPIKNTTGKLYEYIGTHILSLVLVAGSYFRHKQPGATGFDKQGKPLDFRHLFDADLFNDLIHDIFNNYFKGFTGSEFQASPPCDISYLVDCLIEEMGVDRHMEEVLRYADRMEMTDKELNIFLMQRGFSQTQIDKAKNTQEDIIMHTGPHLGRFNRRISVPALIGYLETCSALCIWGNFRSATQWNNM